MQWSDKYSVGVDYLDRQHKKIIDYINQAETMNKDYEEGKTVSVVHLSELLTNLVDYTKTHFSEEEKMMKRHGMRDLGRHQQIHANLITQVNLLRNKVLEHGVAVLPILVKFLNEWLQTHILGIDRSYSNIIGAREVP